MRKVSTKQAKLLRKYAKVRKEYLSEHPLCEIDLPGCTRKATEIHHTAKKQTEQLWLDKKYMRSSCNECHCEVEKSPSLAKELGIYNYKA